MIINKKKNFPDKESALQYIDHLFSDKEISRVIITLVKQFHELTLSIVFSLEVTYTIVEEEVVSDAKNKQEV